MSSPNFDPENASDLMVARICSASAGLIGVQMIWGLQSVCASRIFQTLGARVADLPILWIAAPITGLLVQPLVGYLGDGQGVRARRRLRFLRLGSVAAAASLLLFASATSLDMAVLALWLLGTSTNLAMQPLRALLADLVPARNRATGYGVQVIFIGAGAVLASTLPWMMSHWFGFGAEPAGGRVSPAIRSSCAIGAAVLLCTSMWTIIGVRRMTAVRATAPPPVGWQDAVPDDIATTSHFWIAAGGVLAAISEAIALRGEVYLVVTILIGFGLLRRRVENRGRAGEAVEGALQIVMSIATMPRAMRRLAVTQFFTWFALFCTWVYAVPAVAEAAFVSRDPRSAAYARAGDAVGVVLALCDAIALIAAFALPFLVRRVGLPLSHAACLTAGAVGLYVLAEMHRPDMLWCASLGMGVAWASILSAPYAIVANTVNQDKVGQYLGIHNIFLVVPQLVGACLLGVMMERVLGGRASLAMAMAAGSMMVAAITALRLGKDVQPTP